MSNSSRLPSSKKIGNEIDRFNDILHAYGDDLDENKDADIDFDKFFTNFDKNDTDDEDDRANIPLVHSIDRKESEVVVTITKEEEQQQQQQQPQQTEHSSQKLNQSVTSNVEQVSPPLPIVVVSEKRQALTATTTKKFKPALDKVTVTSCAEQDQSEQILKYLSPTEKTFETIIMPLLPQAADAATTTTTTTTVTNTALIEELRQMALLEHKLQMVNLDILLWTAYLKSGTGTLKQEKHQQPSLTTSYRCVWPKKLKEIITTDSTIDLQEKTALDHATYLNYVNRKLTQFQEQRLFYQTQIQETRERLKSNITPEIEQNITNFVAEHGIALDRIVNEGLIAAVEYNYMEQMIEFEFKQEDSHREHFNDFQALAKSKTAKEKAKVEVELLKQRVAHQQLSPLFESFQLPAPPQLQTIQDESIRQRLMYRYEQLIQRTKSEIIIIHIRTAEAKMEEYNKQFDKDLKQFYQKQRMNCGPTKFTQKMFDIMDRHFQLIDNRFKTLLDLKYGGLSPSMIQNTAHRLSFEQVQFLNRGPNYILPAQIHLFSSSSSSKNDHRTLKDILIQQFIPLRKQLLQFFTRYSLNITQQTAFRCTLEQQFIKCFSQAIPIAIEKRAYYEKQLLQSIQLQLKQYSLILRRTADDCNTFYLSRETDFNHLAQNQLGSSSSSSSSRSGGAAACCFRMIDSIDSTINTTTTVGGFNSEEQYLTHLVQSMDTILQGFVQRRLLHKDYFMKLQLTKKTDLKLPYLYFLPITHQNGHIQLQPRLSSCKNAPVRIITNFLDQLLRPLFENCSQATTFADGHDFIQRLQQYCLQADCLTLNSQFVTFTLHNIYMCISHADLLNGLNQFLLQQLSTTDRYQWLTINGICELTKFALEHHIFTYNGKIYRYIKGIPLNFTFTQLLIDIYLHKWQVILVRHIRTNNQFYGRYHNQGIFTWNNNGLNNNDSLHACINELNEQNVDIQLTISTGIQVHFLDAHIENQNGVLHTRVYQNSTVQPFLLPYTAEHPRLLHRQYFRFRLARAIQYCPLFDDFQEQCLEIQLTFLANGYSLHFVHYHLDQFFKRFKPPIYNFVNNRMHYKSLRQHIFRYYNQKKVELKEIQQQQQKLTTIPRSISFYYSFDWGNRIEFNRIFYDIWSTIVMQDPKFAQLAFKVLLRSKHSYSSNTLLVRYK